MISVNAAGVAHAKNLIAAGKVNKGSWSFSASDGDALLGPKGDDWESFGKYHLAVHTDQPSDTKAHFGYPFGKDGEVYRAGVIAAKSRAAAQGDSAIESAASTLLELIDGKDGASQRASLRTKLPSIHLEKSEALRLRTPQSALERWDPQLAAKSAPAADEGEISILDEIGPDWMGMVSAPMVKDALKRMEGAPVRVVLNSPGGDAFEGVAIYNLLREYPGKVTVHVLGLAASAASVIAMAGDRIEMGEAAFLMIHSAWGMVVGNKKDMQQVASLLDQIDTAIAEVYARRSGQKVADVMTMMEAETWLAKEERQAEEFFQERLAFRSSGQPGIARRVRREAVLRGADELLSRRFGSTRHCFTERKHRETQHERADRLLRGETSGTHGADGRAHGALESGGENPHRGRAAGIRRPGHRRRHHRRTSAAPA
jgi:ATP-dependent protease ClpP protease subunit